MHLHTKHFTIMKNTIIAILLTLSAVASSAAEKVGLVLSGGGARGIAHVGVIKALEDNDIPIDYVAGTSMGAVVGSLYSIGWSPEKMMDFITSDDFHHWSTGKIDVAKLNYVSRPDPTPQWIDISFGNKDANVASQVLPKSLIDPTPMNIEFLTLFTPYTEACGGDFDKLFVPFRCVFSDVYKKHKVVCRNGSLGRSVRGSMSFPLVYRSIEVDSILAFDGGIYDNFPVDVMREDFAPDFIIGVSVSKADTKPNVDDMYSELEDLIIQNNDYSLDPKLGVKIQVPVSAYGTLSFDKADEIYAIGYRTGLEMVDSIKSRLKARRPVEDVTCKRNEFSSTVPVVSFDSVAVEGVDSRQRDYLMRVFMGKNGNHRKKLTLDEVENSYFDAVSEGSVDEIIPEGYGRTLVLKSTVKYPWRAGAGGWLTTGVGSMIFGQIGYHSLGKYSTDINLNLWGGQSYCAAQVKGRVRLNSSNPSFATLEGVVSKKKYYDNLPFFFSNDSIGSVTDNQIFVRGSYEAGVGRSALIRLSGAYGTQAKVRTGKLTLEYDFNTLGTRTFPTDGRRIRIALEGSRLTDYNVESDGRDKVWKGTMRALWTNYYALSQYFKVGAQAEGGFSAGHLLSGERSRLMTSYAFCPLESMDNYYSAKLRGDDFVAAGIIPAWCPMSMIQLRGEAYVYTDYRTAVGYRLPFRKSEFLGRASLVGTFGFATISLSASYCTPLHGWNFGVALGWYVPVPTL